MFHIVSCLLCLLSFQTCVLVVHGPMSQHINNRPCKPIYINPGAAVSTVVAPRPYDCRTKHISTFSPFIYMRSTDDMIDLTNTVIPNTEGADLDILQLNEHWGAKEGIRHTENKTIHVVSTFNQCFRTQSNITFCSEFDSKQGTRLCPCCQHKSAPACNGIPV